MVSPFVRRRRLAAELRRIRTERGLTPDALAALLSRSCAEIHELEDACSRLDLPGIIELLDRMEIPSDTRRRLVRLARDATARGWWDAFGDGMGERERVHADIESGATTICEYRPGTIPGILQTPGYTRALIEQAATEGPISYAPERLVEARLIRQRNVLRAGGPSYEVILDEAGLRRFSVAPQVMQAQLRHIADIARAHASVAVRILPLDTQAVASLMPASPLVLYTFADPADPPMAVAQTACADVFHSEPADVARCVCRYEAVRDAALPEAESLEFMEFIGHRFR